MISRRIARIAACLLAIATVVVLWASSIWIPFGRHLDEFDGLVLTTALRPQLAAIAAVISVIWLLLAARNRWRKRAAIVILLASTLALVQIAPRLLNEKPSVDPKSPQLTILSLNGNVSAVSAEAISRMATQVNADVIALSETKQELVQQLAGRMYDETGYDWSYYSDRPSERSYDKLGGWTTSLVISSRLKPQQIPTKPTPPRAHGTVRALLGDAPGGRDVAVAAVHPLSPTSGWTPETKRYRMSDWRRDLKAIRPLCKARMIVAGDFNATVDHSPMRSLFDRGCSDAATAVGKGLDWTWSGGPGKVVRAPIDHVLTPRGWQTVDFGVLDAPGSDHRAIWARLRPR